MCIDKFIPITLFVICCQSLVVDYHYDEGIRPFSYQTFSSYSMDYNNGKSYIDFDLQLERDNIQGGPVFIELIVIPDININDIGIKEGGNLHLCCNPELFGKYGCSEYTIAELIIPKPITGLYREKIPMEGALYNFKTNVSVEVTGIHVFALATCDSHLQLESGAETLITFNGTANWVGIKHTNSTINITAYDCIGLFIIILIVDDTMLISDERTEGHIHDIATDIGVNDTDTSGMTNTMNGNTNGGNTTKENDDNSLLTSPHVYMEKEDSISVMNI